MSEQENQPSVGEKWGEFPPVKRQAELKKRMEAWDQAQDHRGRHGSFAKFKLTGADFYWLAVTARAGEVADGQKALDQAPFFIPTSLHLDFADLSRAELTGANLSRAQLKGASLNGANLEGATLLAANLEGADLRYAKLTGAWLNGAQLKGADLTVAVLTGSWLGGAHLEGANLQQAYLEGAVMEETYLAGADLRHTRLTNHANLREARFDEKTKLAEAKLDVTLRVADVLWNGAPLVRVDWGQVPRLGDETVACQTRWSIGGRKNKDERLKDFEAAARANRQLAIELRRQGISDVADRFTYRALIMQRKALWWQLRDWKLNKLGAYLFSGFLAALTGYGYRLWRIFVAYLLLISLFAFLYHSFGIQHAGDLDWLDAFITSITAFHGRVFSSPFMHNPEPQAAITALEAIFGLVIEGVFIAMLTQRFFNR